MKLKSFVGQVSFNTIVSNNLNAMQLAISVTLFQVLLNAIRSETISEITLLGILVL